MPKSYWTKIQTPNGLKYFRADEVTDELMQKIKDESSNVFWAEYDVTQFDDIKAAYDAGKSIYVVKSESRNSYIYSLKNYFHYESDPTMDQFLFTCMCQSEERLITCFTSNWNTSATRHFANYSDVSALSGSVAPSYSRIPCPISEGTYATKNYVLYKANTEITSESTYATWDDSQWNRVTVGAELKELESSNKFVVFECRDNGTAQNFFTGPTYAELEAARTAGKTIVMLVHYGFDTVVDRYLEMTYYGFGRGYFDYRFIDPETGAVLQFKGLYSDTETHVWSRASAYDDALSSTSANAVQNKTLYAIINDLQARVSALEGN